MAKKVTDCRSSEDQGERHRDTTEAEWRALGDEVAIGCPLTMIHA